MHRESYLAFLDSTCADLTAETRASLETEYEVITEGFKFLNSVFHGLVEFSENDDRSDDIAKSARTTIALSMSKTLQAALVLQERDMVGQSLSLCRDALEATFVWKFLEMRPEMASNWFRTADEYLHEFAFGNVVRATGDREQMYPLYRNLCKYSHASGSIFWHGLSIEPSEYALGHRRLCCARILMVTRIYLETVMQVYEGRLFKCDEVLPPWLELAERTAIDLLNGYAQGVGDALGAFSESR